MEFRENSIDIEDPIYPEDKQDETIENRRGRRRCCFFTTLGGAVSSVFGLGVGAFNHNLWAGFLASLPGDAILLIGCVAFCCDKITCENKYSDIGSASGQIQEPLARERITSHRL